jgi:hypothetical protein
MKRLSWAVIFAVAALTATALFLTFLVFAPAFGIERLDERWVAPIVAIGIALGAAALGGHASVKGKLPIAFLNDQQVSVSLGGGIATFFLVLLLFPQTIPVPATASVRDLELAGSVVGQNPPRVMLKAHFKTAGLSQDVALVLIAYEDDQCERELARGQIDQPQEGNMTLFVRKPRAGVACGRIATLNSTGSILSQTPPALVKWND